MALDSAIGRLLDCVGPQTTTIIFGGPGMVPTTPAISFRSLLRQLGGRRIETGI